MRKLNFYIISILLISQLTFANDIISVINSVKNNIAKNDLENAFVEINELEKFISNTNEATEYLDLVYALQAIINVKLGDFQQAESYARKSLQQISKNSYNDKLSNTFKLQMESIISQLNDNRTYPEKIYSLFPQKWITIKNFRDKEGKSLSSNHLNFSRFDISNISKCRFGYIQYSTKYKSYSKEGKEFSIKPSKQATWLEIKDINFIKIYQYSKTNQVSIIRIANDKNWKSSSKDFKTVESTYEFGEDEWKKPLEKKSSYVSHIDMIISSEQHDLNQLQSIVKLLENYKKACSK